MMPFIVLFCGLLLIFFEFYLPGGILGTLGAIVVLGSIVLFAIQYDSPILILLYTISTIIILILLFKYALWRIKNAPENRSIYSHGDQEGYIASYYDKETIGKVGVVDTDLRPGGHIIVEGKRLSAISQSGYINKGTKVLVVDGQGESLIVKHYKKDTES